MNEDTVRYLIKEKNDPLNIIVMGATHERYETALASTGKFFYSISYGKTWNSEYGRKPKNYFEVETLPHHINYDLILCHTSCERLDMAVGLKNYFGIPLVRMTHVLPDIRYNIDDQLRHFHRADNAIDQDLFISEYNAKAWHSSKFKFINHGLDTKFWNNNTETAHRENIALSAVNFWADRDWACGWNLWNDIIKMGLKYEVAGSNENLSRALRGSELLEFYNRGKVFLNTSLHSPIPMVLLEAMSCGCVPVSTNNCMIPEIIKHGENGLLGNTAEELYNHCQTVFNEPELAQQLGANARKTIEQHFNIQQFTDNWNKTFEDLLV